MSFLLYLLKFSNYDILSQSFFSPPTKEGTMTRFTRRSNRSNKMNIVTEMALRKALYEKVAQMQTNFTARQLASEIKADLPFVTNELKIMARNPRYLKQEPDKKGTQYRLGDRTPALGLRPGDMGRMILHVLSNHAALNFVEIQQKVREICGFHCENAQIQAVLNSYPLIFLINGKYRLRRK